MIEVKYSLNDLGLDDGTSDAHPWHENQALKTLAEKKRDILVSKVLASKVKDDFGNEIVPQVISDLIDLALKRQHTDVVHLLARTLPIQPKFVADLNRVLQYDLNSEDGLVNRWKKKSSQNKVDEMRDIISDYFKHVLEPWSLHFSNTDVHGEYNHYSLRPANEFHQSLIHTQTLLEKYRSDYFPQGDEKSTDLRQRVHAALQEVQRLLPSAEQIAAKATLYHDMLFKNMPHTERNAWPRNERPAPTAKDRPEFHIDHRITGHHIVEKFTSYRDGDFEEVPIEIPEGHGRGVLHYRFARMKVATNPRSSILKHYADHVVVGVDKIHLRQEIDYPSDQVLEDACTQKDTSLGPSAGSTGGSYRPCKLYLSAQRYYYPQVYSRPRQWLPNDQVFIDLLYNPGEKVSGKKVPIVKHGLVEAAGDLSDLSKYHHRVGTFVAAPYDGTIEVEFRVDPYEMNPFDTSEGSSFKKKFPRDYVRVAPNTYLQALCYTRIWDPAPLLPDKTVYSHFNQPEDIEALGGDINSFDKARALFVDLLKHEDIEAALHIPDMSGHTPLEIIPREVG